MKASAVIHSLTVAVGAAEADHEHDLIAALLLAIERYRGTEWHPIRTAPLSVRLLVGCFAGGQCMWVADGVSGRDPWMKNATHWMSMPNGPEVAT